MEQSDFSKDCFEEKKCIQMKASEQSHTSVDCHNDRIYGWKTVSRCKERKNIQIKSKALSKLAKIPCRNYPECKWKSSCWYSHGQKGKQEISSRIKGKQEPIPLLQANIQAKYKGEQWKIGKLIETMNNEEKLKNELKPKKFIDEKPNIPGLVLGANVKNTEKNRLINNHSKRNGCPHHLPVERQFGKSLITRENIVKVFQEREKARQSTLSTHTKPIHTSVKKREIENQYNFYKGIVIFFKNIPKENRTNKEHAMVRKSCYHTERLRDLYSELYCCKLIETMNKREERNSLKIQAKIRTKKQKMPTNCNDFKIIKRIKDIKEPSFKYSSRDKHYGDQRTLKQTQRNSSFRKSNFKCRHFKNTICFNKYCKQPDIPLQRKCLDITKIIEHKEQISARLRFLTILECADTLNQLINNNYKQDYSKGSDNKIPENISKEVENLETQMASVCGKGGEKKKGKKLTDEKK